MSANNIEGVVAYLNHLAEVNKKDIKVSYLHYEDLDGKHEVKKKKSMVKKLFGKNNLVLTLSLMIIWFTQAFGSSIYSWLPLIMLNHGFVKSKVYVFMMVVQSMPFISIFYASKIIDGFGRRILLFWSSIFAG
ncbi:MAG TPA: MFS transporter, partial [Candidatus Absconditabacterales bacterium]|nr:MFS transporter [Candidatus Absconditabacterales bacterium]